MASIPCAIQLHLPPSSSPPGRLPLPRSPFLAAARRPVGWLRPSGLSRKVPVGGGGGFTCWFKFGKNGLDSEGAGVYGSQSRNDFDRDDVEQYFNYMGMLAVEGSYDKMDALLNQNIHPIDILLMLAATEGDKPKIEELMRAGAKYDVKDADDRTALERAASDDVRELILSFRVQNV